MALRIPAMTEGACAVPNGDMGPVMCRTALKAQLNQVLEAICSAMKTLAIFVGEEFRSHLLPVILERDSVRGAILCLPRMSLLVFAPTLNQSCDGGSIYLIP